MNEDLAAFIIKELSKHRDRKEIIRKVCEQGGLNWKEAEQLTILVEAQHKRTIEKHQSPLLLFLSIATLLLGLGLLAYNIEFILSFFHRDLLGQILSARSSYYRVVGLLTGVGMTAGGMFGLWKALIAIFPD